MELNRFAIRYWVNGIEYWDNNYGYDYHDAANRGVVGGSVSLGKAEYAGSGSAKHIEGIIYVSNDSFHKRVGIHYTSNGSSEWKDFDASYSHTDSIGTGVGGTQVETWKFSLPASVNSMEFVCYYKNLQTGVVSWDNNFYQNYLLLPGRVLE